jgi:copper(I)-binding protein
LTRMTRRLLAGAIVALIPALAGCEAGLNAPTLQFHPAANGGYGTVGDVTINNAFVLGAGQNQSLPAGGNAGVFLAIYSQNGDQLESVSAPGVAASVKLANGPVDIAASNSVNLTGPTPEIVLTNLSAPLSGGQTVTLDLDFQTAGVVAVQVPVQSQAAAYATYDQPPTPAPSPTPTASSAATVTPAATATTSKTHHKHAHAGASATPTPSPSA